MARGVTPTPVPFSGFLSLTTVSQQIQTSWPYFVPPPFLGFPFRVFPSSRVAHPSRGHFASLWSFTGALKHCLSNLITGGFLDAHAHAQLPDSPAD